MRRAECDDVGPTVAPTPHLLAARRGPVRPVPGPRRPRRSRGPGDPWPHPGSVADQAVVFGIRYNSRVEEEAADHLGVPGLGLPLPDAVCGDLAAAWKRITVDKRPVRAEVQLGTLLFMRAVTESPSRALVAGFLANGQTADGTRRNVGVRLAGQLFGHGRAAAPAWPAQQSSSVDPRVLAASDEERERITALCFRAAIAAWSVVPAPKSISPQSQRFMYGMRGVARKYLAHHDPDPVALLTAARADFEAASDLGVHSDRSPQHFDLLAQVLIRLHEHDAEPDGLDLARGVVREALREGHDTPPLVNDLGTVLLRCAQRVMTLDELDPDDPLHLVRLRAARSASQGAAVLFGRVRRDNDDPALDAVARASRGLALGRQARVHRTLGLPFAELLDDAVDHLRICARVDGPYHGTGLTGALLARAQHRHRTKDYAAAEDDVREALDYAAAYDDAAESRHLLALASLDVELQLRHAVDAGDVVVTRQHLRTLLDLPPGAMRTATPLAYAARLLLTEAAADGLSPDDSELIDEVVRELVGQDRSDVQRWHVRYVTWHAATILGVLRQTGAPGLEERIHHLLERSLAADPDPPSPVLVLHAGRAAAALARKHMGERAGSVEAGLLLDLALAHYTAVSTRLDLDDQLVDPSRTIDAVDRLLADPVPPGPAANRDATGEDLLVDLQEAGEDGRAHPASDADLLRRIDRAALASRIAEVHLRSAQLDSGAGRCREALRWFELAHRLGNHTAELLGLTGDALHRLDRYAGTASHRRRVLSAKAAARAAGSVGRENPSLCASILHRLWQEGDSPSDHHAACAAALTARDVDPHWAWPLIQLADLAEAALSTRSGLPHSGAPELELVRAGDADELRRRAVEVAVRSDEFTQLKLNSSSRTFTYALDDPHDLLSSTLVLKPTMRADAEREREASHTFAAELRVQSAPRWMAVPVPVAIVPYPGPRSDVVYAMRRAAGIPLSERLSLLTSRGRATDGRRDVDRAVTLLARFHAWRGAGAPQPALPSDRVAQLLGQVADRLRIDARGWVPAYRAAVPQSLSTLGYKDAHTGNWLVGRNDLMVALDMESSSARPVIFELPRLVEDYPVIPVTEDGWDERAAVVATYLAELRDLGVDPGLDPDSALRAYQVFTAVGCVTALAHHTRESIVRGLQADDRTVLEHRVTHWSGLLTDLSLNGVTAEIRTLAAELIAVTDVARNRIARYAYLPRQ